MIQLVNFHLSWFTKKGPHKSPKNSVFPVFYERFWDLWGPFLGDRPKWKISRYNRMFYNGKFVEEPEIDMVLNIKRNNSC